METLFVILGVPGFLTEKICLHEAAQLFVLHHTCQEEPINVWLEMQTPKHDTD